MKMNRRRFIATSLAGAGTVMWGGLTATAAAPMAPDPFTRVPLGKSGLMVSRIGMGTGVRGSRRQSNLTRMGTEKAVRLLHYAWDAGVRFYDCADSYGTHGLIREAFRGKPRDAYVICSKLWMSRPEALPDNDALTPKKALERFRRELGTDYVDLVQIHCMTAPGWFDQFRRQADELEELRQQGVIRAHGVSIHSLDALKACVGLPWVQVVHARINAYGANMDDKDPARVAPVLQDLHRAGKGVLGMKLIGEGKFTKEPAKIDESLKYVLGLGAVDAMLVGFEAEAQIDDFAARLKTAMVAMPAAAGAV
ncbi:MAG: aldo/keto reductase [Opitutae bacterium]|nr:aldo/keto reductase [Opitutae bacterium]